MKKILALLLSTLMLVSCFGILVSADTVATAVMTDGTAESNGVVVRNNRRFNSVSLKADTVIGKFSGSYATDEYAKGIWDNDNEVQLANSTYEATTILGEDGTPTTKNMLGVTAKLDSSAVITKFKISFNTNAGANNIKTNQSAFYGSVNGSEWVHLVTVTGVETTTASMEFTFENTTSYNYVALMVDDSLGTVANGWLGRMYRIYAFEEIVADGRIIAVSGGTLGASSNTTVTERMSRVWTQPLMGSANTVQTGTDSFTATDKGIDGSSTLIVDGTAGSYYGAWADFGKPTRISYFVINSTAHSNVPTFTNGKCFYGSNDGANWTKLATVAGLTSTSTYLELDVSDDTEYRYVAYMAPSTVAKLCRFDGLVAYTYDVDVTDGAALDNMTTIDDGTVWLDRDKTQMWEKDEILQWQVANVTSLGSMGLGAAAKLECPTKLTGFELKLDESDGKEGWKVRTNDLSVYASEDGTKWIKLHSVEGCTATDISYVINVDDDTYYNYVGVYADSGATTDGFRLANVTAYGIEYVSAPAEFMGIQFADLDGVGGKYNARFVGTLDSIEEGYTSVGFEILLWNGTATEAKMFTLEDAKVYTTILGGSSSGIDDEISVDGKYLIALTIENIPEDYDQYVIKTFVTDGTTRIYGRTVAMTRPGNWNQ